MAIKKVSENVFVAEGDIFVLGKGDIDIIKSAANASELKRARINIHGSDDNSIHEMIIAFTLASKVLPHRHPDKIESFHIIEGVVEIRFYDDNGTEHECNRVKLDATIGPFFYRLQKPLWHSVHPLSDICVLHEITNGPFVSGRSSVFPGWASKDL